MTYRRLLALGVLLPTFINCSGDPAALDMSEDTPAVAESALFVTTGAIRSSINVCWAFDGYENEKYWVHSAVAATWQQQSALWVVGWGRCPTDILWDMPADLLPIYRTEEAPAYKPGFTHLQLNFTLTTPQNTLCQSISEPTQGNRKYSREDCIRWMSLHEFGHALGFQHEQDRTDTPGDSCVACSVDADCAEWGGGPCQFDIYGGHCVLYSFADETVGPWDLRSVMNYCNPSRYSNGGYLSEMDKVGLQRHYGRPNYFADITGDRIADAIVVNSDAVYAKPSLGMGFGETQQWTEGGYFGDLGTYFADVTGDGTADAIVVNEWMGVVVRRSNKVPPFGPNELWTNDPLPDISGYFFADVTADGKADMLVYGDSWLRYYPSNGSAFSGNATGWVYLQEPIRDILVGDVTGDKRADVVLVTDTGLKVAVATASGISPPTNFTTDRFLGRRGNFLTDVTGDGKADLVAVEDWGIDVRPSLKTSFGSTQTFFAPEEEWLPLNPLNQIWFANVAGTKFLWGFTDKRSDLIFVGPDGMSVGYNSGSGFSNPGLWTGPFYGL